MLAEEIDKYLQKLEVTAPTKDFAKFINSLRMYIHNVNIGCVDCTQWIYNLI